MEMISGFDSPDDAERGMLGKLERKEKIMGFGHAIYRESDPRNAIIKKWAEKLAADVGDSVLYPVSVRCEEVMWREKKLFCNADFFHASAYHFMDIPTQLFTRSLSCRGSPAGARTYSSSAPTIALFAPAPTTPARKRANGCRSSSATDTPPAF